MVAHRRGEVALPQVAAVRTGDRRRRSPTSGSQAPGSRTGLRLLPPWVQRPCGRRAGQGHDSYRLSGLRSRACRLPNTERAYRADAAHFAAWCAGEHRRAQPATVDTLVAYVRVLAVEHAPATVRRRLAGIAATHRAAGLASPIDDRVRLAVASAAWTHRRRRRDTEPLDVASLRRISAALPRHACRRPRSGDPVDRLRRRVAPHRTGGSRRRRRAGGARRRARDRLAAWTDRRAARIGPAHVRGRGLDRVAARVRAAGRPRVPPRRSARQRAPAAVVGPRGHARRAARGRRWPVSTPRATPAVPCDGA